ncbi:MAG TPA: VanZ family protein [Terriglobales bacterium]|nr:VanZ family protein [Terriglobales bacterium]
MNSTSRSFVVYFLPALIWTAVVLMASNDTFSAEHTGSVLKVFLGWMQPPTFDLMHFLIRKSAHLTEYGILGFLWFRAWRGMRAGWNIQWARFSFAFCLAVAAIDEFHQSFVPSRTSTPRDVAIDCVGVLITLLITRWWTIRARQQPALA